MAIAFVKQSKNGKLNAGIGDITQQNVDVIVNAANSSLLGGSGVDGAIHRAGGSSILAACQQIRQQKYPAGLPTGQVVLTTAGDLFAKAVIHTVGPIFNESKEKSPELLSDCYRNALKLAKQHGFKSIAFPAISTGVFGYPVHLAAKVVSDVLTPYFQQEPEPLIVWLIFYHDKALQIFLENSQPLWD